MTETTEKKRPVDAAALLTALAEFWADPQPDRVFGRMPGRIAGGQYDQAVPDGIRNPYWEIVRQIPCDTIRSPWRTGPEPDAYYFNPRDPMRLMTDRHSLCATFSWSIPSPGDIAWITDRLNGRGIVEPGAGGGYWAWQLSQAAADVIAYDPRKPDDNNFVTGEPWFPVQAGDESVTAAHPDRSLLLCWPSYSEPWGAKALASYQGSQLFYIGEGEGGCCADDEFFALLSEQWEDAGDCPAHVTYSGIHCYLTEYRRKS